MNQNNFAVADGAPYPPVPTCTPNARDAQRIRNALGCAKSELSAITTYEYQHWTLAAHYPELAETLSRIAAVEMHHLDLLGRLVVNLGGEPRFCCDMQGRRTYWSGGAVNYTVDVRAALRNNIADEKAAVDFYQQTAAEIGNPEIAALLNRLILDEALHIRIFTRCLQQMQSPQPPAGRNQQAGNSHGAARRE